MADPLGFFITWATYGTWLPGDERGWVEYRHGWHLPDPIRKLEAEARMTEDACWLSDAQRRVVEDQIAETCLIRGWQLYAVNCRSNHLHVVLAATVNPKLIRSQLKAWCTRRLKEMEEARLCLPRCISDAKYHYQNGTSHPSIREKWWAERGSQRYINDNASLESAILYVRDGQDRPRTY